MTPIIAKNKIHLQELIVQEIKKNGLNCSLNHIDVSRVTEMKDLFFASDFDGDISRWNTSGVDDMTQMFYDSKFKGDISSWDVSKVTSMYHMFYKARHFTGDLTHWRPSSLEETLQMFHLCPAPIPYWAFYNDSESVKKAIEKYDFALNMYHDLDNKDDSKRPKI